MPLVMVPNNIQYLNIKTVISGGMLPLHRRSSNKVTAGCTRMKSFSAKHYFTVTGIIFFASQLSPVFRPVLMTRYVVLLAEGEPVIFVFEKMAYASSPAR